MKTDRIAKVKTAMAMLSALLSVLLLLSFGIPLMPHAMADSSQEADSSSEATPSREADSSSEATPSREANSSREATSSRTAVRVSTVDELIAAIRSGTAIVMEAGTYDLSRASSYGKDTGNSSCYWSEVWSGDYELVITGVENFSIAGENAEIVTEPRCSNVLRLVSCRTVELTGLTIGHTEAAEACEGGVLRLENCNGVSVIGCSLYGCGTIGVDVYKCSNISVRETEIHHCSSSGVSFTDSDGLRVSECGVHDCGGSGKWEEAFALFYFSDSKNIELQNCSARDNNAMSLVGGSGNTNVQICALSVSGNRFDEIFGYSGMVEFYDLSLADNRIDSWYSANAAPAYGMVWIDGEGLSKGKLDARFGSQISERGIGTVEVTEAALDYTGTKEVHVKTVDEFLAAIGDNTTVYIDAPQLDLTEASDYGSGSENMESRYDLDESSFEGTPYRWVPCYDGYGLWIGGIRDFHIVGEAEIITTPRYANVLSFSGCADVSIESVTLGHTPEGYCAGGVLFFQECGNVVIDHADLYGCGILGIEAAGTENLTVQNSFIHDCTCGAAQFSSCDQVIFLNSRVEHCPSRHFTLYDCTNFSWDGRLMDPDASFDVE